MTAKAEEIQVLLEPVVEAMGFELWGVRYFQGKQNVLRLYIDAEAGVTVDDCAEVSHQVSGVLDVENPITSEYMLEISSPGMDRPLFKPAHWQRFIGEPVKVRLFAPVAGRRKFSAVIKAVEGDDIIVEVDDEDVRIPFTQIDRAHLDPVLD
jgi:ribosome maturation factor RimP